jgi:hypothetical protein
VPVAEIGAVKADDDRPLRHGQLLSVGGTVLNKAGSFIPKVSLLSGRDLVQVVADGRRLGIDWQHVLQEASCQAIAKHFRVPQSWIDWTLR